jgi:predicted nucleic acid-binding protein
MASQKPKIVYWKPGGVVRAQQVYLDANFLLALSVPEHIWHNNAKGLLQVLQERKITLMLSSLALNEVIYQLLKLARQPSLEETNPLPPPLPWPDRLNEAVLKLDNLKNFEPTELAFHRQTIRGVAELGLDPTDAFHYAAAHYLNCPIVTNDAGFQKIADQHLTIVTFY